MCGSCLDNLSIRRVPRSLLDEIGWLHFGKS